MALFHDPNMLPSRAGMVAICIAGKFVGEIKAENWKIETKAASPFMEMSTAEAKAYAEVEPRCPICEMEKQQMEEKANTFYERDLVPLRIRALQVQERWVHSINKYRHDRTTHDGAMTVDRPMFLTVVGALRNSDLLSIDGWNLVTMASEVEYEIEGDGRTVEMELIASTKPTIRVPAKAVIQLVEAYKHRVVEGNHASTAGSFPKKAKPPYKRTTTKASEIASEQRPVWNRELIFRGTRIMRMTPDVLKGHLATLKKEAELEGQRWEDEDDWDGDQKEKHWTWTEFLHPVFETLLIEANNRGLSKLVNQYGGQFPACPMAT